MANDQVTQTCVDKILEKNPNEITKSFIESLFASYHDKTTNIFVGLFCDVNTLLNILSTWLNVGFGISTIFI